MRITSLFFLLREALFGLFRHRLMTLVAVSTAAICFTIVGAFLSTLFTLQSVTAGFTSELGVMVFMRANAARADTERARAAIALLPGVAEVKLVTKEQAWARMKADHEQLPLDGIAKNPLSDELRVQLRDVDHIAPVAKAAAKVAGVDEVTVMRDVVNRVQATERVVKRIGAGAGILLLCATVGMIANVIRLTVYARRREIRIMQLVGATNSFIRLPFLLEGLAYGLAGGGLAAAVVYYGGNAVLESSQAALPFLPLSPADVPAQSVAVALVIMGGAVGLLGSAASVRKFLKT